jgi:hypothetical protein
MLAWISNPRALGRVVWAGLTAVVLCMVFFASLSTFSTHVAVGRVHESNDQQNAYEAARYYVTTEESLERMYRLQPSPQVRELHAAAAARCSLLCNGRRRASDPADVADRRHPGRALAYLDMTTPVRGRGSAGARKSRVDRARSTRVGRSTSVCHARRCAGSRAAKGNSRRRLREMALIAE